MNFIGFFALCDDRRLTGSASVELRLNKKFIYHKPRRAAIYYYPKGFAMRLAKRSDFEYFTERIQESKNKIVK